jgi:hypothetical protein
MLCIRFLNQWISVLDKAPPRPGGTIADSMKKRILAIVTTLHMLFVSFRGFRLIGGEGLG